MELPETRRFIPKGVELGTTLRLGLLIKNLTHMSDLQMSPFPLLDPVVACIVILLCIKFVRSADQ